MCTRDVILNSTDTGRAPSGRGATYESMLRFAAVVRADLEDWKPRDMIDIQSFIWVPGSAEYD